MFSFMVLRTKIGYLSVQRYLTGFNNRHGMRLLRGTSKLFKCISGSA